MRGASLSSSSSFNEKMLGPRRLPWPGQPQRLRVFRTASRDAAVFAISDASDGQDFLDEGLVRARSVPQHGRQLVDLCLRRQ